MSIFFPLRGLKLYVCTGNKTGCNTDVVSGLPDSAGDVQYLCGVFRSVPLKFVLKRKQNSPRLVFNAEPRAPARGRGLEPIPWYRLTLKLYISSSGVRAAIRCCLSICTFRPNRICTVGVGVSDGRWARVGGFEPG